MLRRMHGGVVFLLRPDTSLYTRATRLVLSAAHLLDEEDTEEEDDEGGGSRQKGGAKGRPKKKDSYAKEKGETQAVSSGGRTCVHTHQLMGCLELGGERQVGLGDGDSTRAGLSPQAVVLSE